MMRITTAGEMRALDEKTIKEIRIPGIVLMENAGRAVSAVILKTLGRKKTVVVCGKGNNGGDGLVVARNLYNLGFPVKVVLTAEIEDLKGDARTNAEILARLPVEIFVVKDDPKRILQLLQGAEIVVDAIFGTGFSGTVRGFYAEVIEAINRAGKKVVSVDIPSGLSSDTGAVNGPCVVADITVTFGFPKMAHIFPPACEYVGELYVADISIPESVSKAIGPERYILTLSEVSGILPKRRVAHHKYSFGHVAVIGGSAGKTGAPMMSASAVLRTGGGLSTVVVPSSLSVVFEASLVEVMAVPVNDGGRGYFGEENAEEVLSVLREGKFSSVVLGPGLGARKDTFEFARKVVRACDKPLVLDADGINAVAEDPEILKSREFPTIVTPHIGEFSRLSGISKERILEDPCTRAVEFAVNYRVVVVLKSGRTVVALPDGSAFVNVIGNPGMATAGTGDVLSGVIGALLGMGISPDASAKLGVFLHSLAGDLAVKEKTEEGLVAGDIIDFLPKAISLLKEREKVPGEREIPFVTRMGEIVGV